LARENLHPPLLTILQSGRKRKNWQLIVADLSLQSAEEKAKGPAVHAMQLDIHEEGQLRQAIAGAALVVSLLPATLHGNVARVCVQQGVDLATASYVSAEMAELHEEAVRRGVTLLNECGLDPAWTICRRCS
jgi:saccharopine dehydrogenase-like NADP-dependent oxidoreductase